MALSLTVLGCSGSYAGPGNACSGYLVRGGGTSVWLDAGAGTLANLQDHVDLLDLDAIVLSHEHPDHWTDLWGFAVACEYVIDRSGVPVYGPAGVRAAAGDQGAGVLDWHVVTDGSVEKIGGLRFTFARTQHPPETLAARVEGDGKVLGYSADSGPGWSLEALGPGLDVALCEATFLHDREGEGQNHMSGRQAGTTARAAGAGRLVVTHMWPTVDPLAIAAEAAEAFGRPVELAVPHLTVVL